MHWEAPPPEIPGIHSFLLLQFILEEKCVLFSGILTSKHLFSSCQQQLPATGVPVTRQRFDHMKSLFDEYVRSRTLQNWKFWIFSIIIKPLFESFNGMVSTTSFKDLNETALAWLDQHCSLPILRPMVLNTLRHLSRTTSILTDPSQLPEQAREAVMKVNKRAGET